MTGRTQGRLRPSNPLPPTVHSVALAALAVLFGCGPQDTAMAPSDAVAYSGATLIVGDGSLIEGATFVVEDGRFASVGQTASMTLPDHITHVDLSGKTVMPAVVNAHAHLPSDREARTELLQHMAYYGTGVVISLGHDVGDAPFAMRAEVVPDGARSLTAGRGITRPEPGRSDAPFWIDTEDEARAAVQELAGQDVDFVKIWVDDRGGQYEKLTESLYSTVIDEAHANGLRVTAHIFALDDAKGLLRAGIDAFAHGIRDQDVDDEVVELWLERPNVVLVPNLPGPGVAEGLSWLAGTVPADRLAEMEEASVDRPETQESFGIQARNLHRLHQAGVTIAFGTDGGSPFAIHQEMADMVRTGMSPLDVITAATSTSAALLGVDDAGQVAPGMSADFIVLNANPLDDITNTRAIHAVYLRGDAVDRDGLSSRFLAAGTP